MPGKVETITAAVTPFTESGDLDLAAAHRLFRLIAGTTGAVLVGGTTGEFPALDDSERLDLIGAALDELGPDSVIAHVGAADARHARKLAVRAVAVGVTRLAAITPYYLPATPEGITAYYCQIAEAVNGAELYAYLFPERTGVTVTPRQFADTAAAAGLKGVKLSGTAGSHLGDYLDALPIGFHVYTGRNGDLVTAVQHGAAGTICAASTAFPEVYASLGTALAAGDEDKVKAAQATVERICAASSGISHLKHALNLRGITGPVTRMAAAAVDAAESGIIEELVRELTSVDTQAHRDSPPAGHQ